MPDALLGPGNSFTDYLLVLLVYVMLFVIMRYANPRIELNFRKTYWTLFLGWSIGTFIANYLLYRAGVMSFLPWLNNAFHTFIWIGLFLGFLYAGAYKHPIWEQFALFAIFSFIVKIAENAILGTWELDHFFGIRGPLTYIIGWSLMDGLYPVLSMILLALVSRWIKDLVVPKPPLI
jgi:hypothetical protein